MSQMKIDAVWRNPNDLNPDPEQPRKKFDQEKINQLSQTMKTQGVINPIEIDENNVIITGEMRWRASKKANLKKIACREVIGLSEIEKFERQTIENLHHNILTSIEKENAIKKLWESKSYKTKEILGNALGLKIRYVNTVLRAYDTRKDLDLDEKASNAISTGILDAIGSLDNKKDRKEIIKKVIEKKIEPSKVRNIVKTIKKVEKKAPEVKKKILESNEEITESKLKEAEEIAELPQDIRKEVLKPEPKITLKEAKEVAQLPEDVKKEFLKPESKLKVEDAKKIAKLPEPLKKEVLKPKSKITIKDAEDIAEIKPELRKEAIKVVEKQKQRQETEKKQTMDYMKDVSTGKEKPPQKVIDLDMKIINQFTQIYKQVIIKMTKRLVESYNQPTQNKLSKIMKEILIHLQNQLNIKGEIIDVTPKN